MLSITHMEVGQEQDIFYWNLKSTLHYLAVIHEDLPNCVWILKAPLNI